MNMKQLFSLGMLAITPAAQEALQVAGQSPLSFLVTHLTGDWGEVDTEDWEANNQALLHGGRIFSVYVTSRGQRLYVITEADRSATTILLPDDY